MLTIDDKTLSGSRSSGVMDAREGEQTSGGVSEESGPLSIDDLPAFYSPAELEQLAGQISQSLEHDHPKGQGGFAIPGFQEVSSSRHVTADARTSVAPSSSLQKSSNKGTAASNSSIKNDIINHSIHGIEWYVLRVLHIFGKAQ